MDANELRALANALDDCDPPYYESSLQINRSLDACIAKAADYLRAQADAQPVAWMYEHDGCVDTPIITASRWAKCEEPWTETALYLHPVPRPQPVLSGYGNYGAAIPGIERPCTCHPDDNPPVPCARKYALNECREAPQREPLSDGQLDAAFQTAPEAVLALASGETTVGAFKTALRRLGRAVERAHGIGGSDAE